MVPNEGPHSLPTRRRMVPAWGKSLLKGLLAVLMVAIIVYLLGYLLAPDISGFGESAVTKETTHYTTTGEVGAVDKVIERQNPRTIWDWISIVGISAVVAGVGVYFTQKQKERDEAATNERTQAEALQAYLGQMSNLMIDQKLGKEHEKSLKDSVRKVAQARTIAVLLAVDADHKRDPLRLVYELGLIKKDSPLISLTTASLDHAKLSELALPNASLSHVDLRATDLSGSNLSGSDLSKADLRGANLSDADLSGADLTNTNLLPYDQRNPARLSGHNLKDKSAVPSQIEVRRSKIKPYLTPTNLSNASLEGTILRGAILGNVDLRRTRGLKQEQIEQAIGNQATKLPKKLQLPNEWRDRSIEEQIANRYEE